MRTAQQIGFAERGQHRRHDRRGVGVAGRLLFEGQRVADLHDPAAVDPADADVLVDLVVDLPHLRRLGDDGVAVDGRGQQAVEHGGLGLQRGVGHELERHRVAGVVPDVGEIDDAAFVADPHLVEHRGRDDGVERLDEPRGVVPGRLFGRHELRGDASLRGHLSLEHRVEGARHRGQRDRVHKQCTRRRRAEGRRARRSARSGRAAGIRRRPAGGSSSRTPAYSNPSWTPRGKTAGSIGRRRRPAGQGRTAERRDSCRIGRVPSGVAGDDRRDGRPAGRAPEPARCPGDLLDLN